MAIDSPAQGNNPWPLRSRRAGFTHAKEFIFANATRSAAVIVLVLVCWIGIRLFVDSSLTRHRFGWSLLTASQWDVVHSSYGALPFIYGTLASATLALLISIPLSIGAAVFLNEVAPTWLSTPLGFAIELLAAIPSIVYGLWGFLVLCPFLQTHVSPWLAANLGTIPLFGGPPVLTNMLAAGVILAVMVMPFITAISREVLRSVPQALRDASFGLGATLWETIKNVVLAEARAGITGAVILGLGRAIGETMAVVMVVGNTPQIVASILKPAYTMPSLLANQFNEAYDDPVQRSALLEIALILFLITLAINGIARLLLVLTNRNLQGKGHIGKSDQNLKRIGEGFKVLGMGFLALGLTAAVVADFRVRGWVAIYGPLELLIIGAVLFRLMANALAGTPNWPKFRKVSNTLMKGVLLVTTMAACFILGALLYYVIVQGARGLNPQLFTQLPRPPGVEGGGLKQAILGTIELVLIATAIGLPVGILGGVFLAEYGRIGRFGAIARFATDALNGIPSVVVGLFAYAAFVLPFGHFSALAGGAALAVMFIPTAMRTTEEVLRLVPDSVREASLGLGATNAQTITAVLLPAAKSGVLTGVMLATARIAGETAPLLFTAFGSDQVSLDPKQPISSLTLKIYQYAQSPYDDWVRQAWAGALVLLTLIFLLSLATRLATGRINAR